MAPSVKYFVPIIKSYYHFMAESVLSLYYMLEQESLLESRDCMLWYQGHFSEIVQLFSCHPIVNVPLSEPCLNDASSIGPDIKTLQTGELWRENFPLLIPVAKFLSEKIPIVEMEKGITLIKRVDSRVYLETDELAEQLHQFHLPVRVVRLEQESFADQVNLMRNTLILVAPHGAGTMNQMFMPEGGHIIELFSKGDYNWHAKAVADLFGHHLVDIESQRPGPFGREPNAFILELIKNIGWPDRNIVHAFHRRGYSELNRVIRAVRYYSIPPERVMDVVRQAVERLQQ